MSSNVIKRNDVMCQGEIDVLIAIDDVRNELSNASRRNAEINEMREIHSRLMSLYAALNVDNVLVIIGQIDYREIA